FPAAVASLHELRNGDRHQDGDDQDHDHDLNQRKPGPSSRASHMSSWNAPKGHTASSPCLPLPYNIGLQLQNPSHKLQSWCKNVPPPPSLCSDACLPDGKVRRMPIMAGIKAT